VDTLAVKAHGSSAYFTIGRPGGLWLAALACWPGSEAAEVVALKKQAANPLFFRFL